MARQNPKTVKARRQRRAWAKSLGRKGSFTPNRDVVRNYKDHARGLIDKEFADRLSNVLIKNLDQRKQEAFQKQGELEAWLPENCTLRSQGPGPSIPGVLECWTYTNTRKDCFVVIHLDLYQGVERRSITYSSRELLLMCWEGDAMKWVYKADIIR